MTNRRAVLTLCVALALMTWGANAHAGDFDARGNYVPDPEAVAGHGFGLDFDWENLRYLPTGTPLACGSEQYAQVETDSSLDGDGWVLAINTAILQGCFERFHVPVPQIRASYRATLWVRHGSVGAQINVLHSDGVNHAARMSPTGRVTSDGWVELATNPFPIDALDAAAVYMRVFDYDDTGSEIDALELVPVGDFVELRACAGVGDPVCGAEQTCIHQRCRLGSHHVPVLPAPAFRDDMVDAMQTQMRVFFGGRKTRLEDLPLALAQLDAIRRAESAWTFWNGWAKAVRLLQDWHTRARSGGFSNISRTKTLDLCFIQGEADLSAAAWPPHPKYPDVMVSHTGVQLDHTHGMVQGDRLVAVDGLHPIAWGLSLIDEDWGYWQANDNGTYAEFVERMRGNLLRYATHFDVIHCNALTKTCDDTPERYVVAELPDGVEDQVGCDNRPKYHYPTQNNPGADHRVGFAFYQGRIRDIPPEDGVYGLLWDTLYGGGDSNGFVNSELKNAFSFFKTNARGVILDHRAGNGGTLDGSETATFLARPPETVLVFSSPLPLGGWDGPESATEGVAFFESLRNDSGMRAGSTTYYDPDMPIALVTHRDGSASDFFPYAMKNIGPKVRIFGPGPTAGAFSTFYELEYWAGLTWALASGDSVGANGDTLIGYGVVPDVIVQQKQSDLVDGQDTIHDAALAWVLTELKP